MSWRVGFIPRGASAAQFAASMGGAPLAETSTPARARGVCGGRAAVETHCDVLEKEGRVWRPAAGVAARPTRSAPHFPL